MKSVHTENPDRINKDNIIRLISMFEVKRPKKSPNSTMRKTKSISSLAAALSSDDDDIKHSERRTSSTSKEKIKRRTKSTRSTSQEDYCDSKIRHIIEDIEKNNKMVEDFGDKLRMRREKKTNEQTNNINDYQNQKESYSLQNSQSYEDLVRTSDNGTDEEVATIQSLDRRIYKKEIKKHSSINDTSCKELISRRRHKGSRERIEIESFIEAKSEHEIELYRKNLVKKIDCELKKMKRYGFIDEPEDCVFDTTQGEYESFKGMMEQLEDIESNGKSTWAERLSRRRESAQSTQNIEEPSCSDAAELDDEYNSELLDSTKTICETDVTENNDEYNTNNILHTLTIEDDFGECLAEDLEANGSYFVEAYNEEGKELIIVEIAVERRAIDLSSLDTIAETIENSDIVFQQNDDKSLNLIDNPKEFVSAESVSSGFITGPESNRSTLYSNASRDSEVYDTDDEGVSLGDGKRHEDDNTYNNYRRETFCDNEGIVRIERFGYPEIGNGEDGSEPRSPVTRNDSFAQKGTLSYIIDEIKTTERKYVEDLERVVTKYMPYIEEHTPANLIGRQCYIFGNIARLYHKQKDFLAALENCDETVDDIVRTFIDFEKLFQLYPKYFKNKPKADIVLKEFSHVIKESQTKFEDRLDLSSYLLTPLQRLGKYKLFLENIEKQLKKLDLPIGGVQMALDIVKGEMSKGNDFVAIESIENSPINKADYGSFKMREKFNVLKPRRFEAMVFLFENIIVFSICDPRNMDSYNYYDNIKMNDLRIATFEDLTIHLTDYTKSKRMSRADRFTYILEAKSEKIKETWRKAVEDILWQQLFKAKEKTLKMYQSPWSNVKENKTLRRKLVKSAGSSKFYVH